jgi:hypothetical protein
MRSHLVLYGLIGILLTEFFHRYVFVLLSARFFHMAVGLNNALFGRFFNGLGCLFYVFSILISLI